jgi:N-acetylmuramoyl-L-alanine amidase
MSTTLARRDQEDCYWLALTAHREARGEGAAGMLAVMQVVMERVFDQRWPNTVPEVVLQPKQFSCFNPGDPNSRVFLRDNDLAWDLAEMTLARHHGPGKGLFWHNRKPNHFHTVDVSLSWTAKMTKLGQFGRHIFFEG